MMWIVAIYLVVGTIIYFSTYTYMEKNEPILMTNGLYQGLLMFVTILLWMPLLLAGIVAIITGKLDINDLKD